MRKVYIVFAILVFVVPYVHGQVSDYYYQYFDGADTLPGNSIRIQIDTASSNVWQIGTPQKVIFNGPATESKAIVTDTSNYYPANNTSSFVAKVPVGSMPWGILALQWKQMLDLNAPFDGGIIEFSLDSGLTWENAFDNPLVYNFYGFDTANVKVLQGGEYSFSGTDAVWKDIWLCFDVSWLQQLQYDHVFFRFTLKSGSAPGNMEGWLIDNMMAHLTFIHVAVQEPKAGEVYLNVYPNPSDNRVHVETQKIMEFHIIEKMELVDQVGRVIDNWENIPTKFWFDVSKYKAGLYSLRVKTNLRSETLPLTISK